MVLCFVSVVMSGAAGNANGNAAGKSKSKSKGKGKGKGTMNTAKMLSRIQHMHQLKRMSEKDRRRRRNLEIGILVFVFLGLTVLLLYLFSPAVRRFFQGGASEEPTPAPTPAPTTPPSDGGGDKDKDKDKDGGDSKEDKGKEGWTRCTTLVVVTCVLALIVPITLYAVFSLSYMWALGGLLVIVVTATVTGILIGCSTCAVWIGVTLLCFVAASALAWRFKWTIRSVLLIYAMLVLASVLGGSFLGCIGCIAWLSLGAVLMLASTIGTTWAYSLSRKASVGLGLVALAALVVGGSLLGCYPLPSVCTALVVLFGILATSTAVYLHKYGLTRYMLGSGLSLALIGMQVYFSCVAQTSPFGPEEFLSSGSSVMAQDASLLVGSLVVALPVIATAVAPGLFSKRGVRGPAQREEQQSVLEGMPGLSDMLGGSLGRELDRQAVTETVSSPASLFEKSLRQTQEATERVRTHLATRLREMGMRVDVREAARAGQTMTEFLRAKQKEYYAARAQREREREREREQEQSRNRAEGAEARTQAQAQAETGLMQATGQAEYARGMEALATRAPGQFRREMEMVVEAAVARQPVSDRDRDRAAPPQILDTPRMITRQDARAILQETDRLQKLAQEGRSREFEREVQRLAAVAPEAYVASRDRLDLLHIREVQRLAAVVDGLESLEQTAREEASERVRAGEGEDEEEKEAEPVPSRGTMARMLRLATASLVAIAAVQPGTEVLRTDVGALVRSRQIALATSLVMAEGFLGTPEQVHEVQRAVDEASFVQAASLGALSRVSRKEVQKQRSAAKKLRLQSWAKREQERDVEAERLASTSAYGPDLQAEIDLGDFVEAIGALGRFGEFKRIMRERVAPIMRERQMAVEVRDESRGLAKDVPEVLGGVLTLGGDIGTRFEREDARVDSRETETETETESTGGIPSVASDVFLQECVASAYSGALTSTAHAEAYEMAEVGTERGEAGDVFLRATRALQWATIRALAPERLRTNPRAARVLLEIASRGGAVGLMYYLYTKRKKNRERLLAEAEQERELQRQESEGVADEDLEAVIRQLGGLSLQEGEEEDEDEDGDDRRSTGAAAEAILAEEFVAGRGDRVSRVSEGVLADYEVEEEMDLSHVVGYSSLHPPSILPIESRGEGMTKRLLDEAGVRIQEREREARRRAERIEEDTERVTAGAIRSAEKILRGLNKDSHVDMDDTDEEDVERPDLAKVRGGASGAAATVQEGLR